MTTQDATIDEVLDGVDPIECIDVEQVPEELREKALREGNTPFSLMIYGLIGVYFGLALVKSEVVSWFRIQEMFRFDSFHMFGIIGSAVLISAISVAAIKRFDVRTVHGEPIVIAPKAWTGIGTRYWLGGTLFGLGWALVGACPGPLFALVGGGVTVMLLATASALAGTWTYAYVRHRLPH